LGRIDQQVKIRGFRVELGEIESILNTHPAVRESTVIAADGPGGTKRLVAYIVPTGTAPNDQEIQEYLANKIPSYMVPSVFLVLPRLPLTANGKIDRRALPAPDNSPGSQAHSFVPPRNATETTLVTIWSQLLGRSSISINENFFHLGGHSLLATQVVSRIGSSLNIELPVRAIFEAPTVAQLAEAVDRVQPGRHSTIEPRAGPGSTDRLRSVLGKLSDAQLQEILKQKKA
jgi:hypothetical protein